MYRSQHNAKTDALNSYVTDADQMVAAITAVAEDHDVVDTLLLLRLELSSNS